jgi:hypothetical protein
MCKESLIFSNSVHLDPRTGLPDKIVKGDHQRIILASPFFIFSNSGHVGWRLGLPDIILEVDRPRTIPPTFGLNWPGGFRGEDILLIVDGRTTDVKWWHKLWVRWAKNGGGGAYYFLSMVKSQKNAWLQQ